jgi:hypothetical protein
LVGLDQASTAFTGHGSSDRQAGFLTLGRGSGFVERIVEYVATSLGAFFPEAS